MKILFVAAECTPIIKVGGLADVVGALPKALRAAGHDVRIIIPKYEQIDQVKFPSSPRWTNLEVPWANQKLLVHIEEGRLPDSEVPVYYLDCPAMFHHGLMLHRLASVYANSGDPDMMREELQRFIFFPLAVAATLPEWEWQPELIHIHDWHAAFFPVATRVLHKTPRPTVLTIHNLQNQGRWNADDVWTWLGWSGQEDAGLKSRDHDGNLNLLQLGIENATRVNTVSPTYAKEILTPAYGERLDPVLQGISEPVSGIINGIDTDLFDPSTDPALATRYTTDTVAAGKIENRKTLAKQLDWDIDPAKPLMVSVGRLTAQKGYQLLAPIADWLFAQPLQLVILGSGTPDVEQALQDLARKHSNFKLQLGFDAKLAQLLYAAGDLFLMPSQFEPCGLGQMIAMRYGTLPIVRATGGLKDTVVDLDAQPRRGTGFTFTKFTPSELKQTIARALDFLTQADPALKAHRRAMEQDFSWHRSSQDYIQLYAKIISQK